MLFITAGMGGGTGTGAAPVIAEIAKQVDIDDDVNKILVVAIVTFPLAFEGPRRKKQAEEGINELRKYVDSIIIINNDKLRDFGNMKMSEAFAKAVKELHGNDIAKSKHYVRMVNDRAFERVKGYLAEGDILYGGRTDAAERFIEPTLLDTHISLSEDDADEKAGAKAVLTEEIFGPVFPILTFKTLDEVTGYITRREKPLAFYYFGREADGWHILCHTSSGGACINDTIMHIANENIPFGGVGNSGMGSYHGKLSFEVFSHIRSVVCTPTWIDLPFRYMPYKFFSLVKKIL